MAKRLKKLFKNKRLRAFLVLVGIFGGFLLWFLWGIPSPWNLGQPPISTKLLDRNGKLIYEIYTEQRRTPISLNDVPEHVKQATLSIEDKDFYKHHSFSFTGMARALYSTVFKQKLEGGSTLTQQLVKNRLLTPERTIKRKVREFVLSAIVEVAYSKDEIFEMYLNQIPYGSTAYGIEAASQLYFGKSAKDLSLSEGAMLAGMPQAPTKYSPFGAHPEYAGQRQATVLRRMVEDGHITAEEAEEAKKMELKYAEPETLKAPHFALWVKELLAEQFGDAVTEQGGLVVTTTLDLPLQELAQQAVYDEVGKLSNYKVGNGAALITRPKTGEILAMVGSKDYFAEDEDGKVNIIFAKRQPGSSIKPINYALAIRDKKITASTVLADVPTCFIVFGQPPYCPSNYDGGFHGAQQTRFALGNSYNIPAVRVVALNELVNFINFARNLGITTFENPDNYGLSITLGGGEVRPFDMAVAFGVLANQGIKEPLTPILKVEDNKGKILKEADFEGYEGDRVLDAETAFIISHILLDNNARSQAFGDRSYLNVAGHPEISVKTGTTNDRRDNWTIGYNTQILALTWVGNNDNTPMGGAVSGISGASPIWNKIIKEAADDAKDGKYNSEEDGQSGWPPKPDGVVGMNVCANTGLLPNAETIDCPMRFEYFLEDSLPQGGAVRQDIQIDKTNQTLAGSNTPPENIETQNHLIITDPLGSIVCLDCPMPTSPTTVRYP